MCVFRWAGWWSITGVSGSGKSTRGARCALRQPAHAARRRQVAAQRQRGRRRRQAAAQLIGCTAMRGPEHIDRVLEVDQTPIGKTPRSCPATYIGFWDDIRRIYAGTTEARMRGYTAEPLLLQHRRRALRGLRRPGRQDHRDELPARRESPVRCLRRPALQPRDAVGPLAREEHRRRARHGCRRGGGVLRARTRASTMR